MAVISAGAKARVDHGSRAAGVLPLVVSRKHRWYEGECAPAWRGRRVSRRVRRGTRLVVPLRGRSACDPRASSRTAARCLRPGMGGVGRHRRARAVGARQRRRTLMRRGEVRLVDLDPARGVEACGVIRRHMPSRSAQSHSSGSASLSVRPFRRLWPRLTKRSASTSRFESLRAAAIDVVSIGARPGS